MRSPLWRSLGLWHEAGIVEVRSGAYEAAVAPKLGVRGTNRQTLTRRPPNAETLKRTRDMLVFRAPRRRWVCPWGRVQRHQEGPQEVHEHVCRDIKTGLRRSRNQGTTPEGLRTLKRWKTKGKCSFLSSQTRSLNLPRRRSDGMRCAPGGQLSSADFRDRSRSRHLKLINDEER